MSTVRVLIVTDDFGSGTRGGFLRWTEQAAAEAVGTSSRQFHLGEFIRVLEETTWIGFGLEITKAHRTAPSGTVTEAQLKADRGADVVGFRFNQSHVVNGQSRDLSYYDMVLFFPIDPGNPDPSLAPEAEAIAQYMEDGHGFFATGDHENLGSKLAGLIPRVRSMRRWWSPNAGPNGEPAAPSAIDLNRHDTTQPGVDGVRNFEDQSDEIGQPIEPAFYFAGFTVKGGFPATKAVPHPLLCSPLGVVKKLPDHMHEGHCEVPGNLAARTFTLAGASVREYPDNGTSGPLAPEIVATGRVVAGTTSPALDSAHVGGTTPTNGFQFGVIGAWDGHRVGKGRVVVDSTWHHFFNINLTGDRFLENNGLTGTQTQKLKGFYVDDGSGGLVPSADYKMIQWYFRNIIYWLIPASRHSPIWWAALANLRRHPQFSEEGTSIHTLDHVTLGKYLYFGQLAEKYFSQVRGACTVYKVRRILYKPKIPWWEWVQDYVDPWDPARRGAPNERALRDQYLGAIGIGPQPEVITQLGLGAAVVATFLVHRDGASVDETRLASRFNQVLEHATAMYAKELAHARATHVELEKQVASVLEHRKH